MEVPVYSILAVSAFGMLVALSGGVLYLTVAEWRDRRRRDRDLRNEKSKRR